MRAFDHFTPVSHEAVAPEDSHRERQAAAVSQEAVLEVREGSVVGGAEIELQTCY